MINNGKFKNFKLGDKMKTLFINAKIVSTNSIFEGFVGIENSKIIYVNKTKPTDSYDKIIDLKGKYLSPGFIDIHVHGGNNFDFMDADEASFKGIADFHSLHGTTSMVATSLSGAKEEILQFLDNFNLYAPKVKSLNYLGVHLEGPYFSMKYKGAQDPKYIRNPQPEEYQEFVSKGNLKGIVASIGHSAATFDICEEAIKHGYTMLTHFYNALSTLVKDKSYKTLGCIEAGLYFNELTCEIISDNRHVPNDLFKMVYKIKSKDRIILCSDALRAAGLKNGEKTIIGSKEKGNVVIIDDDIAKLEDLSAFAGSTASGDRLVRTVYKGCNIPLQDAVYMMTVTPAKMINVFDKKGSIEVGKDADLIIFDDDVNVSSTYVMGENIY